MLLLADWYWKKTRWTFAARAASVLRCVQMQRKCSLGRKVQETGQRLWRPQNSSPHMEYLLQAEQPEAEALQYDTCAERVSPFTEQCLSLHSNTVVLLWWERCSVSSRWREVLPAAMHFSGWQPCTQWLCHLQLITAASLLWSAVDHIHTNCHLQNIVWTESCLIWRRNVTLCVCIFIHVVLFSHVWSGWSVCRSGSDFRPFQASNITRRRRFKVLHYHNWYYDSRPDIKHKQTSDR